MVQPMKKLIIVTALYAAPFMLSTQVFAHDPSLHAKKAEKPKCEALAGMSISDMDQTDPVVIALLSKCGSQTSAEEMVHEKPAQAEPMPMPTTEAQHD